MPPRKRQAQPDPAQTDLEDAVRQAEASFTAPTQTPAEIIKARQELKTWSDAQTKAFNEHMAPHRQKIEEYDNQLLALAIAQGVNSFNTDFGTAYISQGLSHKVDPNAAPWTNPETGEISTGREALLDWLLENWADYGAEWAMVNIGVDGVKAYMEKTKSPEHPEGLLPPGISIERWKRMNVRKS